MPSSGPGWVYILTNPTLPGVCKIGQTRRTAAIRAREVSRAYGTALPFTVASRHAVPDAAAVEWLAHRTLRRCRLPSSELFQCDPGRAAAAVHAAVLSYRPPSRRWRWLRRLLTPAPGRRPYPAWRRYRRGTNWIPLLLAVSIAAAGVMIAKPAPAAWWPPPVARTILLLERIP
jgi:hypothetical protein